MFKSADFSPCRTYRYTLWRIWTPDHPHLAVIGLNPSTATETEDDPTVRRCIRYAQDWGYGGLVMTNLFGLRSTDPRGLRKVSDPVGPGNDAALAATAARAGRVLAAWGTWGAYQDRGQAVRALLQTIRPLYCLGRTKAGEPKHPLYQRADAQPELLEEAAHAPPAP